MTEYSNGLIIRYVLLISSVFNRYPSLLKSMSLTDRARSLLVSKKPLSTLAAYCITDCKRHVHCVRGNVPLYNLLEFDNSCRLSCLHMFAQCSLHLTTKAHRVSRRSRIFRSCIIVCLHLVQGGSVAQWLAYWTQAQKGLGSNRSRDAAG